VLVGVIIPLIHQSRVEVNLSLHNWNVYSKSNVMNFICQFPMGFYFPFDEILHENIIVKREKLKWKKKKYNLVEALLCFA
jgi:hypothetical protein